MASRVQFEVAVSDIPYFQRDGEELLARVYRPVGTGPFPTVVDVHGGAWTSGDRQNDKDMDTALAAAGIVTVAVDFRQPPTAGYPASIQDVNLAIRWLKRHAHEFGGRERVGALGVSSGGHVVLLAGLRPRDRRYTALTLDDGDANADASLAYVVACWPVSDPLYRYQLAQEANSGSIVKSHDAYWGTEDAMAEGSPPRILERGEDVDLPPVLVIQRTVDANHPLEMQERLVNAYRARGGDIEMPLYDNVPSPFALSAAYPDTQRVVDVIASFVHRHG
ncbi:MAG: hypothetical protein NVSMB2_11240 [Chloroflexota bacterium]